MGQDNSVIPYQGVPATDLSDPQRRRLLAVARSYTGWKADAHAAVTMAEIESHLDETWFSWYGGWSDADAVLLPRTQPGDPHRVRPSRGRRVRQHRCVSSPHPHARAHAERRRLRPRPAQGASRALRPRRRTPRASLGRPVHAIGSPTSHVTAVSDGRSVRRRHEECEVALDAGTGVRVAVRHAGGMTTRCPGSRS